jgi:hypothetical protein
LSGLQPTQRRLRPRAVFRIELPLVCEPLIAGYHPPHQPVAGFALTLEVPLEYSLGRLGTSVYRGTDGQTGFSEFYFLSNTTTL